MRAGLLGFLLGALLTGLVVSTAASKQLKAAREAAAHASDDGRLSGCNALIKLVTPPQLGFSCALQDGKLVAVSPLMEGSRPIEQ